MKKVRDKKMEKAVSRVGYLLAVAVLLSGLALAPQAQCGVAPAGVRQPVGSPACAAEPVPDPFTGALIDDLKQDGFQVSQGCPALYKFDPNCLQNTYPVYGNCFLGNPAAPYVLPVVKLWPDEYVDPATKDGWVDTDPGYSVTYRFDPRGAIVIYGQMPPPGRYMGLQTWEFSEHGKWKTKDYNYWANTPDLPYPMQFLFDTVPPDDRKPQRVITFSALGDIINNVDMEWQSGVYPFSDPLSNPPVVQTFYFIITPSDATNYAIRLALQEQGVPDTHIFTEQIPSEDEFGPIGPLGMGKNAIDFITAFRYAVPDPDYQTQAQEWRDNPPLTVLRVRAPASLGPVQRYKSLTFEPRKGYGYNEAGLAGGLQNLVDAVCSAVTDNSNLTSTDCAQEQPPASSFMTNTVSELGWVGPYCMDIGMNCQGDQQDVAFYMSSPRSIDSGQVYAIVGTLATETGNATYVALSANAASIMGGVANVTDHTLGTIPGLFGSAEGYSTALDNPDDFFVHYFAKECSVLEPALVNVPGGLVNCTELSDETLGDPTLRGSFMFSLRDYVAQGRNRGPDASYVLTPRILTFTQP
jgi:hypothetical protein